MSGRSRECRTRLPAVDRLREWFGSPTASAKTVVWLMWASLLVSLALGVVLVAIAALPA